MFDRLVDGMRRWLAGFDAATLSGEQASSLLDRLCELERLVGAAKALVAKRAAETNQWRHSGDKSPEGWLARRSGTTITEAREQLDTAKRLASQPKVDKAVREGKLSSKQAAAVSDAVAADPDAADELLDAAPEESLAELRRRAERIKAAARSQEDEATRQAGIHRSRYLRTTNTPDGAFELHARGTREQGAMLMARLRPFIAAQFKVAREEGRRESPDAYAWDALRAMSESGGSAKSPAKVIVRVDLSAIRRGTTGPGEICEIPGFGPIPVAEALKLMNEAFLALVLTKGNDVHNVVHLGRHFTEHQKTALEWTDPECKILGCSCHARLELDHIDDWARTRQTSLRSAERLCHQHHLLKTMGWHLEPVPGTDKHRLLPPKFPAAAAAQPP